MKNVFIVFVVIILLTSCHNSDKTQGNTHSTEKSNKFERQVLIEELKKFQQIIASNDKEKIGDIFDFPLSNSSFSIFVDDEAYYKQLKSNQDEVTKEMFLQHYEEIRESIWVNQLNELFQNINLEDLLNKDSLEYEAYFKDKPCFYSYQIEVLEINNVMLKMNMNSNREYINENLSEEDMPENSSEICEHSFWWILKFDGKEISVIEISGAD